MSFSKIFLFYGILFLFFFAFINYSFINEARTNKINDLHKETELLANLIQHVSEFDMKHSAEKEFNYDGYKATLSQVLNSFQNSDLDMEYLMARQVESKIIFEAYSKLQPPSVDMNDIHLAVPMRKALNGETGVIVENDYLGEKVFAAYRKIKGTPWGLVIKEPYSTYMQPFIDKVILIVGAFFIFILLVLYTIKRYKVQQQQLFDSLDIFDEHVIASKSDLKGVITEANQALCNISGYTKEELLGQPHAIF